MDAISQRSPIGSFGKGVAANKKAIAAAIEEPWSNGQTEGQITKLKLVKRQMYGRGKIDLLRARLLGADWARCTEIASEPRLDAILHHADLAHRQCRRSLPSVTA